MKTNWSGLFAGNILVNSTASVLLSPSLYALKHYITVCEDYAKRFNILFNPIKSKLMCFNVNHKDFVLYLCNQPVNLAEHETYLGNYIVSDIFDRSISHTVHTFLNKKVNCIQQIAWAYMAASCSTITVNCMWHGEK